MIRTVAKVGAVLVLGVVALVVILVAALPSMLETDELRQALQQALSDELKRPVEVGALDVSLLPDVEIRVDGLKLGPAPDVAWDASAKTTHVGVALMPLLKGDVVIQSVALEGAVAEWHQRPAPDATPSTPPPHIPLITLRDGDVTVHLVDRPPIRVRIPSLRVREMKALDATLLFDEVKVDAKHDGRTVLHVTTGNAQSTVSGVFDPLDVAVKGDVDTGVLMRVLPQLGVVIPKEASASGQASVDGTITGPSVKMAVNGTRMALAWGQVASKRAGALLTINAEWEGDPAKAIVSGSVEGLKSGIAEVGHANVAYRNRELTVTKLSVSAVGSKIEGNVNVRPFAATPSVEGTLGIDVLDVDAWRAAAAQSSSGSGSSSAWNAKLQVKAGVLKSGTITLRDVETRAVVQQSRVITLEDLKAHAWDGTLQGSIAVDGKQKPAAWDVSLAIKDAQMAPLLRDTTGKDHGITGVAKGNLALRGRAVDDPLRSAEGQGDVVIDQLKWPGGTVMGALGPSVASMTGLQLGSVDLTQVTRISGPLKLTQGHVQSDALILERPNGATLMNGWITLDGKLDVLGRVIIWAEHLQGLPPQWSFLRNEKGHGVIPFIMKGTLQSPVVTVDAARLGQWFSEHHLPALARRVGAPAGGVQDVILETGSGLMERLLRGPPSTQNR